MTRSYIDCGHGCCDHRTTLGHLHTDPPAACPDCDRMGAIARAAALITERLDAAPPAVVESIVGADPQVSAGSTPFQGDVAASGPSRERMDGPAALTFAALRAVNAERCARWHPGFPNDGKWNGADWSNAAAGEMGEACNVVKKLRRQETGGRGAVDPDVDVLLAKLGDEIADTIIYLDLLAAFYGIDTAASVTAKFNAVSVREGLPERLPPAERVVDLLEATKASLAASRAYLDAHKESGIIPPDAPEVVEARPAGRTTSAGAPLGGES